MISGNIPEKITILTRKAKMVNGVKIIPAFVSDATNEKTLETGRKWAKGYYYKNDESGTEYVGRENKATGGYEIIDLEVRSEGGRAYKVVSPDGFCVDLREDVLLDTILEVGISPGGVLNGDYLFATVGSQMKLIREGSSLHTELIGATTRRKAKKISSKDLEVGGVYSTLSGENFVFGGFVDTIYIKSKYNSHAYYYRKSSYEFSPAKKMKKAQLWLEASNYKNGDTQYIDVYKTYDKENFEYLYLRVDVLKDKKVIEKIGQLEKIDYVEFIKEKTKDKLSKDDNDKIYSKIFNMVPCGT